MLVSCIFFSRVLYCCGGGVCGGSPLSTLRGVTCSGGILWTPLGASNLVCIREGSCWVDIIDTLGSGIVTCGVGDVEMGRTGAAFWKISAS